MTRPDLCDAITGLDLMTMYDRRGGGEDPLDPATQRAAVAAALQTGEAVAIWQGDTLAAYAMFVPRGEGVWFATGIALHPEHRHAGVMRQLRAGIARFLASQDVAIVESNVFKTNRKSVALHRRLGFEVFRENDFGYAFRASAMRILEQIDGFTGSPVPIR